MFKSGERAVRLNVRTVWHCRNAVLAQVQHEFWHCREQMLQDVVFISGAIHQPNAQELSDHDDGFLLTPCHRHHQNCRLVACSLEHNASCDLCCHVCIHQHVTGANETRLKRKQPSFWQVPISHFNDTTAGTPISDVMSQWSSRKMSCLAQQITNCLVRNSAWSRDMGHCGCCLCGSISKIMHPHVSSDNLTLACH